MPTFDVDQEEITAFEFNGKFLFKEYFDEDLFQQLEEYYNSDKYRFEVPENELSKVRQALDNFFYELDIADNIIDYCVIQDKESDSSTLLRNAVASQRQGNYEIFLMKDTLSVRQAVEQGASLNKNSDFNTEDMEWKID